jgi:Cu-processing system ATP-binding protein
MIREAWMVRGEEMIRYSGFSKSFGSLTAVHELDLAVGRGETLAVLGPNGSGKTTTLKAALGLVRPTSGTVRVAGHDATRAGRLARARLGYLPQRLTFPEGCTAREAMALFARIRGADPGEIGRHLERVGLAEAADRTAETFSGGMRQRLGLAIALLGAPSALILDEPTAALDPSGALMVRDLVETIREEGTTVLLSSHDLAEVSVLADRIAIFVDGRVAALGSRRELVRELGLVARLRVECAEVAGSGRAELAWPGPADAGDPAGVCGSTEPGRLAALLARAGGRRIRWEGGVVLCDLEPGREALVLEALREAQLPATEISVERPGLEEIYRAVTMPSLEKSGPALPGEPRGEAPRVVRDGHRPVCGRGVVAGGRSAAAGGERRR